MPCFFDLSVETPNWRLRACEKNPNQKSWLTPIGPVDGDHSVMNIMASGGIFDDPTEVDRTDPPGFDGTIALAFESCTAGTIEYDIPSINRQGIIPI